MVGGRVTSGVINDIAYISYLIESKVAQGPWFEVAIIHHTECDSALFADHDFRHGFAQRVGVDEVTVADTPVVDPVQTVSTDVKRLRRIPTISSNIRESGHVYDVQTGLLSTIVDVDRTDEGSADRNDLARSAAGN